MENGNHVLVQFSRLIVEAETSLLDEGCDEERAFTEAVRRVVMRFALPVEPHEQRILDEIRERGREGKEPVTSLQLASMLNIPHSTLQRYLSELETRMLVRRPWGPRNGWAVVN